MIPSFYQSPSKDFTLIQGDCIDVLSRINFGFDMVFADPPYFLSNGGISIQSGKRVCVDKGDWDKSAGRRQDRLFHYNWLKVVREKLKRDGTIWISGTYHNIFTIAELLVDLGFRILNAVTWVKPNPPPNLSCRFLTYSSEIVLWARREKTVPHYYNYELMRIINGGRQMRDVWPLPAIAIWEKTHGKHPTQKPLGLLTRIILASTKPGAWVLDPFSGSGTTGIAANLLGRKFLGVERETNFLKVSRARRLDIENRQIAVAMLGKIPGFEKSRSTLAELRRVENRLETGKTKAKQRGEEFETLKQGKFNFG